MAISESRLGGGRRRVAGIIGAGDGEEKLRGLDVEDSVGSIGLD
jgi:hypothetical protein